MAPLVLPRFHRKQMCPRSRRETSERHWWLRVVILLTTASSSKSSSQNSSSMMMRPRDRDGHRIRSMRHSFNRRVESKPSKHEFASYVRTAYESNRTEFAKSCVASPRVYMYAVFPHASNDYWAIFPISGPNVRLCGIATILRKKFHERRTELPYMYFCLLSCLHAHVFILRDPQMHKMHRCKSILKVLRNNYALAPHIALCP